MFFERYSNDFEILLQFKMSIYSQMWFIPVIKAEFVASLLQSSVWHDPAEIIAYLLNESIKNKWLKS